MLDGSIHDGIIIHGVYVVTITQENFKRTGDQMFSVSSQEKFGKLKGKLENLISWQKTGRYMMKSQELQCTHVIKR